MKFIKRVIRFFRERKTLTKQQRYFKKQREKMKNHPFRCDHCGQPMDPEVCESVECDKPAETWSYYTYDEKQYIDLGDDGHDFFPTGGTNRHWFIRCWDHRLVKDERTPNLVVSTKEECLIYLTMHQ